MKRYLVIMIVLILKLSSLAAFPSYNIKGWLDPDTHSIAGNLHLEVINDSSQALHELSFFLPANLDTEPNPYISQVWRAKGHLKNFAGSNSYVVGVKVNGQEVPVLYEPIEPTIRKYSLHSAILKVPVNEVEPNQRVTVEMEFVTATPQKRGDKGWNADIHYWTSGWHPVLLNPVTQSVWRALYTAELLVPASVVVASGADSQKELSEGGIYKKVYLKNDYPAYSLPLVAGAGLYVKEESYGHKSIYTYYLPGHEQEAVFAAKSAANILEHYEPKYGSFEKKRLTIVEGSSLREPYSAEGLICLPISFYRYYNTGGPGASDGLLKGLIAKEVARSWFSLPQPLTSTESLWLEEALCNYIANEYFSYHNLDQVPRLIDRLSFSYAQKNKSLNYQENLEQEFLSQVFFKNFDEPLGREYKALKNPQVYDIRIKTRGFLTLQTFASFLGRETMTTLLEEIVRTSRAGKLIDNTSFLALAENVAKRELADIWQRLVFEQFYDDLSITNVKQQKTTQGFEIEATVKSQKKTNWPIEVLWEFTDGSQETTHWILGEETIKISSSIPLKRVTIDPWCMLLDVERINNTYPRKTGFSYETKHILDSTTYSLAPEIKYDPTWDGFEVNTALYFNNRFYNGWSYSLDLLAGLFNTSLGYWQEFSRGKLDAGILSPGLNPEKFWITYHHEVLEYQDIGYTALHLLPKYRHAISWEYLPKKNDYNLQYNLRYDDLIRHGSELTASLDFSQGGSKLTFGGLLLSPSFAYGVWRTAFNVQTSFLEPYYPATTLFNVATEQSGDYAVTIAIDALFPIALGRDLARVGPIFWEDAEGKLFLTSGAAWYNEENPLAHLRTYIGGELDLGFNLANTPFSLAIIYAKELYGNGPGYSSIRISTRFFREKMGK